MNTTPFYINSRFYVDPSTNIFRDLVEKKESRIEPRIMEVLCLLASGAGSTLSREELVSLVWKEYKE